MVSSSKRTCAKAYMMSIADLGFFYLRVQVEELEVQ